MPARSGLVIREAVTDADLEAWRHVFMAVVPNERAGTIEQMRASSRDGLLRVLAEDDGEVVGSGITGRSDLPDSAFVAPRVLPERRRRGVGRELLRALLPRIGELGVSLTVANVEDPGSLAFANRFGFAEIDRQVEQVRTIGAEPATAAPDGVKIVTVAQRPELWRAAYDVLGAQAFEDMAVVAPLQVTVAQWERDWIGDPAAMFLALSDDEVIGCAGLIVDEDQPDRAENALTAVRRGWRRRGIAAALKRTTLVWAAANGIREVYTWTQRGNADMRRLNEHLGYYTRTECITVRAALPLRV